MRSWANVTEQDVKSLSVVMLRENLSLLQSPEMVRETYKYVTLGDSVRRVRELIERELKVRTFTMFVDML